MENLKYQNLLNVYENQSTLAGKAWQHACSIDLFNDFGKIEDCSMHCYHYQQMFEFLFKYTIEKKSKLLGYTHTHKLYKLLEQVIGATDFRTDKNKYESSLLVISVCAESYRYDFLLDCDTYYAATIKCDSLISEILKFLEQ